MDKFINKFIIDQIVIEFKNYVEQHFISLEDNEQTAFLDLLKNADEYTEGVLKRLHEDFQKEIMTDAKMESLRKKANDMIRTDF
jgi:uncharacterized protein (DUF1778 family)